MTGEEANARGANPFRRQLDRINTDAQLDRLLEQLPELAWSCETNGHTVLERWLACPVCNAWLSR